MVSAAQRKLILAVSASTKKASLALGDGQTNLSLENPIPRKHSEFLNLALDELLKKMGASAHELTEVRVDQGPGSFTGERAAVSFAKTLAFSLDLPILATTSLRLLLRQCAGPAVALIDAHRNLLYVQASHEVSGTPRLVKYSDFDGWIKKRGQALTALGDGFEVARPFLTAPALDLLLRDQSLSDFPQAATLLRSEPDSLEKFDWKTLFPLYIRPSSAEEVLQERNRTS